MPGFRQLVRRRPAWSQSACPGRRPHRCPRSVPRLRSPCRWRRSGSRCRPGSRYTGRTRRPSVGSALSRDSDHRLRALYRVSQLIAKSSTMPTFPVQRPDPPRRSGSYQPENVEDHRRREQAQRKDDQRRMHGMAQGPCAALHGQSPRFGRSGDAAIPVAGSAQPHVRSHGAPVGSDWNWPAEVRTNPRGPQHAGGRPVRPRKPYLVEK